MKQFCLGQFEVEPHAVDLLLEFSTFLGTIFKTRHIAQTSDLEHGERQPRKQVVAPAGLEFFGKVECPVVPLKLHAVHEESPEMPGKRSDFNLDGIGHMVQIAPDRLCIHVVQDGSCRSWSTVDDTGEGFELDHGIELPFPIRDIYCKDTVLDVAAQVDRLIQAVDWIRSQADRHQFGGTAGVDKRYPRIDFLEYVEERHLEPLPGRDFPGVGQENIGALVPRQGLRPERPA